MEAITGYPRAELAGPAAGTRQLHRPAGVAATGALQAGGRHARSPRPARARQHGASRPGAPRGGAGRERSPGAAGRDAARGRGDSRARRGAGQAHHGEAEAGAQERQAASWPRPRRAPSRSPSRSWRGSRGTGRPDRHGGRSRHAQRPRRQRPARTRAAVSDHGPAPATARRAHRRQRIVPRQRECPALRHGRRLPWPRTAATSTLWLSTLDELARILRMPSARTVFTSPTGRRRANAPRSIACCRHATPTDAQLPAHRGRARPARRRAGHRRSAARADQQARAASSPPTSRPRFRSTHDEQRPRRRAPGRLSPARAGQGDDSHATSTRTSSAASWRASATVHRRQRARPTGSPAQTVDWRPA